MTDMTLDINTDPTFGALISAVKEDITKFKTADSAWVAANGDRDAQLKAYKETSEDEQAVKIRDAIQTLNEKLNRLAEENVKTNDVDEATKEKLTKARNEARTQVRNTIKSVQDTAGLFERQKGLPYVDTFNAWLKEYGDPSKTRAASTGEALPKVPVEIKVTVPAHGDEKEVTHSFSNFTAYATWRGVDTKTVQEETAAAAGLAHKDLAQFAEAKTYQVQRGDLTLSVRVSPKATKPRGRKAAEPSTTPAAPEVNEN